MEWVLTQSRWEGEWAAGMKRLNVDRIGLSGGEEREVEGEESNSEDMAYVIYTSGSTGEPKGVVIEQGGVANTIIEVNRRWGVGEGDRVLALSGLSFDLSVYDVFGMLAAGGGVVMPEAGRRRDPAHWVELMEQEGVTIWNSVPALLEMLVEYVEGKGGCGAGLRGLRLVLLSGDWIPKGLVDRLRRLTGHEVTVVSLGGATEASIWSIAYEIEEVKTSWSSVPYGRALGGQRMYVLDEEMEECPKWVTGEIYIGGRGLARGYWKNAEQTAARFVRRPGTGERLYRTGDMGRYQEDGNIELLGRADRQVKVHGYRIELGEVEAGLKGCRGVWDAVVEAEREGAAKRLVAYVVTGREPTLTVETLRKQLQERLPAYLLPSVYHFLPTFPLTHNGKIDREALKDMHLVGKDPARACISSRTPVEDQIARLWAECLDVRSESVEVRDNFFESGGDSIHAVRLLRDINKSFDVALTLEKLLLSPTVAGLAAAVEDTVLRRVEALSEEESRRLLEGA